MGVFKDEKEIHILREGGKRLAAVLDELVEMTTPGRNAKELDDRAYSRIREMGDVPAFLDYRPEGARKPYPASICISINDEIVHGLPGEDKVFKEGDVVSIDLGLAHEGLIVDTAYTVGVGEVSKDARHLMHVTRTALEAGIAAALPGNHSGDIGYAIENVGKKEGVGIFRELVGHGVGYELHEDPQVPNYGISGKGEFLVPGMALAIEPMFSLGSERIRLGKDGFTYMTYDGSLAAHFEHTIVITEDKPEIITKRA